MDKEFLEIIGNRKPTGSALKETIVVSVTISINVQKRHSRIRLRILSCSRAREMRREPEVTEEKVPVVECLDGLARITSKELAPINDVKSGILQYACACFTCRRMGAVLVKSALLRIARLTNSPAKRTKKNGDKSAVAMLKKNEQHQRTGRLVKKSTHQIHNNWVASFRIWSRRSLHRFCGRTQTYGNQSDVQNSQKPSYVTLTFETKILRSE